MRRPRFPSSNPKKPPVPFFSPSPPSLPLSRSRSLSLEIPEPSLPVLLWVWWVLWGWESTPSFVDVRFRRLVTPALHFLTESMRERRVWVLCVVVVVVVGGWKAEFGLGLGLEVEGGGGEDEEGNAEGGDDMVGLGVGMLVRRHSRSGSRRQRQKAKEAVMDSRSNRDQQDYPSRQLQKN
jgi:hypothetical protein